MNIDIETTGRTRRFEIIDIIEIFPKLIRIIGNVNIVTEIVEVKDSFICNLLVMNQKYSDILLLRIISQIRAKIDN